MSIFLPLHRMVFLKRSSRSAIGVLKLGFIPWDPACAISSTVEVKACRVENCFLHVYEIAVYFGLSSRLTTRTEQDI